MRVIILHYKCTSCIPLAVISIGELEVGVLSEIAVLGVESCTEVAVSFTS